MLEHSLLLKLTSPEIIDDTSSRLRQEYKAYASLFQAQPAEIQNLLKEQAAILSEAVEQGRAKVQFTLPELIASRPQVGDPNNIAYIPADNREQSAGGWLARLTHTSLLVELNQRLAELGGSPNQAVSAAAGLLRYAIAIHMVYDMLPTGKSVIYATVEGDDIPNRPADLDFSQESGSDAALDKPTADSTFDMDRTELMSPYVEAASHFYLPQWVAFDGKGQILVASRSEAEAYIQSLQHYLAILQSAVAIAPYMIADETWQQKRYGALGQLVNQGRALANYELQETIHEICRRVEAHKLDRGLSLCLPYFDEQKLAFSTYKFTVIPTGLVMFVPAFLVLAARDQQIKVAGDTTLSIATRRHLLAELNILERAFLR